MNDKAGASRHQGPWPWGHHPWGALLSRMASTGFCGPMDRSGRARRWMHENPTDDQVISFLEEYQRDLEEEIEDVRTRIEDIKGRSTE